MDKPTDHFHIKEFAEALGIESYNLRFYERSGLFQIRRDDSGYRLYTEDNGYEVSQFLALQSIGMSVPEAIEWLEHSGKSDMFAEMDILSRRLDEEAFLLECKRKKLREYREMIALYSQKMYTVHELSVEPFFAVRVTKNDRWNGEEMKRLGITCWNRLAPAYYHGLIGSKAGFELFYMIPDTANQSLNLGLEHHLSLTQIGRCIGWLTDREEYDYHQYPQVEQYLHEHRLTAQNEQVVGFYLMLNVRECSDDTAYLLLSVEEETVE